MAINDNDVKGFECKYMLKWEYNFDFLTFINATFECETELTQSSAWFAPVRTQRPNCGQHTNPTEFQTIPEETGQNH